MPLEKGGLLSLQLDQFGQQTLRAVVLNSTTNQPSVGPRFAGSLSVTRDLAATLVADRSAEPLPVNAYSPVAQVAGLKIRAVPKGSNTDVESLWPDDDETTAGHKRPVVAGERGDTARSKDKDKDKDKDRDKDKKKKSKRDKDR